MHELGLAEAIVRVIRDIAGNRGVNRVKLRIGRLRAIEPETMEFNFAVASHDTVAEGAELEIESIPGNQITVEEIELEGEPGEVLRRPHEQPVGSKKEEPQTHSTLNLAWS